MARLKPQIVAQAARSLYGTGHSESIVFFFLKAQGAKTDDWINVTSANDPPEGLLMIAGQPEGFDELVKQHEDEFSDTNDEGLPTRPGRRGTLDNYSMYFPITEETQYILRKRDCNRNAVWSNLVGGRGAPNSDRASREDIFETRGPEGGPGKDVRLKQDYVLGAFWYYGPRSGVPMQVPLRPLAVWLHRTADLDATTDIEQLVERAVEMLHITEEERYLIFARELDEQFEFRLTPEDYTADWRLDDYFAALCLPGEVSVERPIVSDRYLNLDKRAWDFTARALGLREQPDMLPPLDVARSLVDSGERNLLFIGPPRTGKSYSAVELAAWYLDASPSEIDEDQRYNRVQFHQSWHYGDFIRKIAPKAYGERIEFELVDGVFLRHCQEHVEGLSAFVIEEINRANVAEVFGEAFQVFERGYRGKPIDLPTTLRDDVSQLVVPPDLLLVATANDLDRTTLPLDFALLARFHTVYFPVRHNVAYDVLCKSEGWTPDLAEKLVRLLHEVEAVTGYPVGHTYFYSYGPPASVGRWYRTQLRPALALYLTHYRKEDLEKADALFAKWTAE